MKSSLKSKLKESSIIFKTYTSRKKNTSSERRSLKYTPVKFKDLNLNKFLINLEDYNIEKELDFIVTPDYSGPVPPDFVTENFNFIKQQYVEVFTELLYSFKDLSGYKLVCPYYTIDGKLDVQIGISGSMMENENIEEATLREIIEETNISPSKIFYTIPKIFKELNIFPSYSYNDKPNYCQINKFITGKDDYKKKILHFCWVKNISFPDFELKTNDGITGIYFLDFKNLIHLLKKNKVNYNISSYH